MKTNCNGKYCHRLVCDSVCLPVKLSSELDPNRFQNFSHTSNLPSVRVPKIYKRSAQELHKSFFWPNWVMDLRCLGVWKHIDMFDFLIWNFKPYFSGRGEKFRVVAQRSARTVQVSTWHFMIQTKKKAWKILKLMTRKLNLFYIELELELHMGSTFEFCNALGFLTQTTFCAKANDFAILHILVHFLHWLWPHRLCTCLQTDFFVF